jgi:hypothetical protein
MWPQDWKSLRTCALCHVGLFVICTMYYFRNNRWSYIWISCTYSAVLYFRDERTVAGTKLCVSPTSLACEYKGNKRIYCANQRHYRHRNWVSELQSTDAGKWCAWYGQYTLPYLLPLPIPLIPLPFTYNGRGTHRFVPATIPYQYERTTHFVGCNWTKVTVMVRYC